MSIEEKILQRIEAFPKGELFLPADFSELGSSEAVRLSLFRLEKEGVIMRVAQGIYVRPKESNIIGKLIPSAEEIAEAIAKRDCIRTVPTGNIIYPKITQIKFGYIEHSDWISQTSAKGQQARLTPIAKTSKMIRLYPI